MAEKLLYAIFNCTEMDADFRTTEPDIVGWGAVMPQASATAATNGMNESSEWQ